MNQKLALNPRFLATLWALFAVLFLSSCQSDSPTEAALPGPLGAEMVNSNVEEIISNLSSLTDPAKLATLGERGANTRVRKICYWLNEAQRSGVGAATVLRSAFSRNGFESSPAAELAIAVCTENLELLRRLGCLTDEGLASLKRGNAPTITRGEDAGELATVDHIIPRSVCPELDNSIVNLKILSESDNRSKSDRISRETVVYAQYLHSIGALSRVGLLAVESQSARVAQVQRQTAPTRGPPEVLSPRGSIDAGYWLNSSTGVRHNSGCRWYNNTKSGRSCGPRDGSACGQCGG